ncbi:hypothetical protein GCM10018771_10530 [Streptomyces cellulosae]|nr:hypothetical protein GCM10018771_10530 [Streptomyces cellulosae]
MNRNGRITLVIGLVAVVLMAFRVSWNALSDVARAIGADPTAALLYPIVVDGLMALALVAALVLTGPDRTFALRVLAAYTIASLLLNYVHGLIPALHTASVRWGRLTDWNPANLALVLLATSLPVGSIYFGSDLVAKVLHHTPESATAETAPHQSASQLADQSASNQAAQSAPDQDESALQQPTESAPMEGAEAPAEEPTEGNESAPAPAARPPRSAAVAESTGAAPRRATGRVPAAKLAANRTRPRTRTDAEVLDEARLLTADWSDDWLTAERLRDELRISQKRARAVRDQLKAERTGQTKRAVDDGLGPEPLDELDKAASQQEDEANAPAGAA